MLRQELATASEGCCVAKSPESNAQLPVAVASPVALAQQVPAGVVSVPGSPRALSRVEGWRSAALAAEQTGVESDARRTLRRSRQPAATDAAGSLFGFRQV